MEPMQVEEEEKKDEYSSVPSASANSSSISGNSTVRDLHPLEVVFNRHISKQKWPCGQCNQDFAHYRDLYLHMEANVHVNVEPSAELKPLYEELKKAGGQKNIWSFFRKKQRQKPSSSDLKDEMIQISPPPLSSPPSSHSPLKAPSLSPSHSPLKASAPTTPAAAQKTPILTSKNLVATFVIVRVDCYFCEEKLDSLAELKTHLLTEHGHKNALCFVEGCYASFDEWDDQKKHVADSHTEADFVCSKCSPPVKMKTYGSLQSHLYKKHQTGIFRCPLAPDHCSFNDEMLREPVTAHFRKFHKR